MQSFFPFAGFASTEEKWVWNALVYTYPIFFIGGLYVSGSIIGWLLLGLVGLRCYIQGAPKGRAIPVIVWLWILAMAVMLLSLLIAHFNWSLGAAKTIKSSIGWAKGWALFAVFPLVGALAQIRHQVLVRAICVIASHSLIFAFVAMLAYLVKLPADLYLSPLRVVGGPGDSFFTVSLYGLNPETGAGRWRFFGPWAPAAGFLACIYFVFCVQEKSRFWRNWGILGCIAMLLMSQSRAGLAIFLILLPLLLFADKLKEPWVLLALGCLLPLILLAGEPLFIWLMEQYEGIRQARPRSTQVRSTLANLAIQRWQAEAPIWGHGIVEAGPKLVEGMPIGSHHSWYGLLFVKGLVGAVAFAVPLVITACYMLWQTQFSQMAKTGLAIVCVLICYSFFENLEILSYLYWPALLWLGMVFNPTKSYTNPP